MKGENKIDREIFKELILKVERFSQEDIDYLMEDLDNWGFFKMPSSCRKHGSYEGGLVKHSINVCRVAQILREQMISERPDLETMLPMDSVIVASLLHDVCKSDIYQKVSKKQKNEIGIWETSTYYSVDYSNLPVGHGEKSVIMLLRTGLDLTDEEILAIRWHMGCWDIPYHSQEMISSHNKAREITPLVTLIHAADSLAADLIERPYTTL
jgi:HD superfamily phosphohydrolase YqeK